MMQHEKPTLEQIERAKKVYMEAISEYRQKFEEAMEKRQYLEALVSVGVEILFRWFVEVLEEAEKERILE